MVEIDTCSKCGASRFPGSGHKCNPSASVTSNVLLSRMSKGEIKAAKRVHDSLVNDGTYDISANMRTILQAYGLIEHIGNGVYHETEVLLEFVKHIE